MEIPDNFAQVVKAMRKAHGWDQRELAQRMGTTSVTISRWENGRVKPCPMHWNKLGEVAEAARTASETEYRWVRDVLESGGSVADKLRRMTRLAQRLERDLSAILTDSSYEGGVQYWIRKHDALLQALTREKCARQLRAAISDKGLQQEALARLVQMVEKKR